jgi:hypothetical protein
VTPDPCLSKSSPAQILFLIFLLIEWMWFEPEAPVPELVRTVPHVAFEVDDLSAEIAGKEILIAPNSPPPGVTVGFIVENGAPVEFLQFDKK